MSKIGLLTIGQSPREEIMSVMETHLPTGVEVLQHGALDGIEMQRV